jgi:transposase
MELRRICKHNYAVLCATLFYFSTGDRLFMAYKRKEFCNRQKILLDFSKIYGIIILTHNIIVKEVPMVKPQRNDPKEKALRDCGAFNTHLVVDALFRENDFFDSRDLVQVKYEMLRRVHKEGESVSHAATSFGFSRPSFYKTSGEFHREGVPGLLPRKRGPRQRHKLTAEVLAFVEGFCTGEHPMGIPALLDEVEKHFGIRVHRRSLERALRPSAKKTLRVPGKNEGKRRTETTP